MLNFKKTLKKRNKKTSLKFFLLLTLILNIIVLVGIPENNNYIEDSDINAKNETKISSSQPELSRNMLLASVDNYILGEPISNGQFGVASSKIGDVNGDGNTDIIVGSGTDKVFLFYGPISGHLSYLSADVVFFDAGLQISSISSPGDINNDGYDDILIADHWYLSGNGRVCLIYGRSDLAGNFNLDSADVSFIGVDEDEVFGYSVAGVGDINKDGFGDIVIGAQDALVQTAYLFYGHSNFKSTYSKYDANATFIGNPNSNCKICIAGAGDVNGDEFDDFLIGIAIYEYEGINPGATHLIYGMTDLYGVYYLSNANVTFIGEEHGDRLGVCVSSAGDFNNDGYSDIIIGAPYCDQYGYDSGKAYLIYGSADLEGIINVQNSDVILRTGDYWNLGYSVSYAGDVNFDGYGDILIGGPMGGIHAASYTGAAYIIFGRSDYFGIKNIYYNYPSFIGEYSWDRAGHSTCGVGDINGDGRDDILISATGYGSGGKVYLIYGRINELPIIEENSIQIASVSGEEINSSEDLKLDYSYFDPDGDLETNSEIRWYKNGVLQPEYNDSLTIFSYSTSKNEQWYATIRPNDGRGFGELYSSDVVTIANSLPVVSNMNILPGNPNSFQDLFLTYDYFDEDGDIEGQTEILWYKNDELQSNLNGFSVIMSGNTSVGDHWYVTIKPHDGFNYGSLYYSETIIIENIIPLVQNIFITPENPDSFQNLILTYDYFDEDGGIEGQTEILWYKNDELQPNLNGFSVIMSGNTSVGDHWYVTIKPHDGINYGLLYYSEAIIIENTIPLVQNISITPENPDSFQNLILTYDYFDEDGGIEGQTEILWYKNDELQINLNGSSIILSEKTSIGDRWNVTIKPHDGINYGLLYYSEIIIIENFIPLVHNISITPENPFSIDDLILNYNFIDFDGDIEEQTEILWYKNDELQLNLNGSSIIMSGNTSVGDQWYVTIKAHDGTNYGLLFSSEKVSIIPNSIPSISHPEDIEYEKDSEGHFIKWQITDFTIRNTSYNILLNSTLYSSPEIWESEQEISLNIDGLELGVFNFTIIVFDGIDGWIEDTVFVTIRNYSDDIDPDDSSKISGFPIPILIISFLSCIFIISLYNTNIFHNRKKEQ